MSTVNLLIVGGSGGGFYSNGEDAKISFGKGGRGGRGFLAGGEGGAHQGGFGGGGGYRLVHEIPGGGGGYSGGSGGYSGGSGGETKDLSCGGGGGSFNNGTNQQNECCYNTAGHGKVIITFLH